MITNPILSRLNDFASLVGGFAEIGRKINKHPSMFYNLVRRDAHPSVKTLFEISESFPDIDIHYIVTGKKLNNDFEKEVEVLKKEIEHQKAIIDRLIKE